MAVFVALFHFVIGPDYEDLFREFIDDSFIDILLPFLLYFLITLNVEEKKWKIFIAACILLFAFAVEYLQHRGIGMFGSVFDPYDLAAYSTGVLLAVLLDFIVFEGVTKNDPPE